MKKLIILLIVLAVVLFTAGCTEETQNNSTNPQEVQQSQQKSVVVEATELGHINTSLQEGPVLMKIGSERCGPCKAMKPTLEELAAKYGGRATVISVDIDKSPQLAAYFGIGYIPDSSVIVNIKDGEYVYMQEDGNVTTDRLQARILGFGENGEKEVFEKLLNLALLDKEKNKSE